MTRKAEKLFEDFHKYEPNSVEQFPASFRIPDRAAFMGPALYVLYRSSKYDPITHEKPSKPIDYIHEHKKGVNVYRLDTDDGPEYKVPKYIHSPKALVLLGKCLGFGYTDYEGDDVEATCSGPELFSIPSGKALLVIEKRRKVVALLWGGELNVEPRGIVG
jgi:hypothetical protein